MLHFSDGKTAVTYDRLTKNRDILKIIIDSFKDSVKPGKNIVDCCRRKHGFTAMATYVSSIHSRQAA